MNDIYLRRKGKLYVSPGAGGVTVGHVAVVQKEAEQLGFVLSDQLVTRLSSLSVEQLTQFLRATIKDLRALVGAHRVHAPLYPGFPAQVLRLSDAELYLNAVEHYLSLRRLPMQDTGRPPLLNGKAPREIGLGSLEDFESICTRLAGAKTSLSQVDKDDLSWFVKQYREEVFRLLPVKIEFKENLAVLGAQLLAYVPGLATESLLRDRLKTATDVLRLAVALADGDVSLAKPSKFKSMKRQQRKFLLCLIEESDEPTEDILRWGERWKRLAEVLHPREFTQRFPKSAAAFAVLRDGTHFRSFNALVETHLREGKADAAARTLQARPGDMARRLDHLLRSTDQDLSVLEGFAAVASRVSTPVLLQVHAHFRRRGQNPLRTFFPKGDVAKVFAIEENRAALPAALVGRVIETCEAALLERFARLPSLGRCYVDPELRHYLVPLAQRSASRSLRTLVRGSRPAMPESRFVRLFLWWMNGRGRADIDLSAVLFGSDFNYIDALTYYKLRNYGGHHSGDIVDAPKGAAEFIDLDLDRLRSLKIRFVVMTLNSYTMQPYCDLPECFAGWMARSDLNSGEIFEPRTVEDRIDVASDTRICLPLVLDIVERRVLWMDIALKENPRWNNVNSNLSGVSLMLRALNSLAKPDLLTLFSLHARARGQIVGSLGDATTAFALTGGVTPFDADRIRAEFL